MAGSCAWLHDLLAWAAAQVERSACHAACWRLPKLYSHALGTLPKLAGRKGDAHTGALQYDDRVSRWCTGLIGTSVCCAMVEQARLQRSPLRYGHRICCPSCGYIIRIPVIFAVPDGFGDTARLFRRSHEAWRYTCCAGCAYRRSISAETSPV